METSPLGTLDRRLGPGDGVELDCALDLDFALVAADRERDRRPSDPFDEAERALGRPCRIDPEVLRARGWGWRVAADSSWGVPPRIRRSMSGSVSTSARTPQPHKGRGQRFGADPRPGTPAIAAPRSGRRRRLPVATWTVTPAREQTPARKLPEHRVRAAKAREQCRRVEVQRSRGARSPASRAGPRAAGRRGAADPVRCDRARRSRRDGSGLGARTTSTPCAAGDLVGRSRVPRSESNRGHASAPGAGPHRRSAPPAEIPIPHNEYAPSDAVNVGVRAEHRDARMSAAMDVSPLFACIKEPIGAAWRESLH